MILEIPQLKNLYDQTEILFRNLQAFEQCHYSFFLLKNVLKNFI